MRVDVSDETVVGPVAVRGFIRVTECVTATERRDMFLPVSHIKIFSDRKAHTAGGGLWGQAIIESCDEINARARFLVTQSIDEIARRIEQAS